LRRGRISVATIGGTSAATGATVGGTGVVPAVVGPSVVTCGNALRVLVNVHTTASFAATLKPVVALYENSVPFLVHTADPGVHPALTDDSDTKYDRPVTTLCDPVDPFPNPVTSV
jgi:hypothetical protein